ncbi:nucleotide exchange factor GrpE [Nitrososphaera sp.]|uniref:nucleotide exchange factor GrpE n=1 Tax=Nitrososphaera sp. TaxID=1971748 RepID=UPI00307EED5C
MAADKEEKEDGNGRREAEQATGLEGENEKEEGEELEALRAELRAARQAAEANLSKLKYLMADFDNYRKQMEKQVASRVESGKAELLLKFLNIRDDYQRALATAKKQENVAVSPIVIEGLEGILKNIDSLLSSEGVRPIEAVGTPFDPNVHDAIAFAPRDDVPENSVTAEIRRGYMLNGKVLRPSMVEIAKKIVKNSDTDNNA